MDVPLLPPENRTPLLQSYANAGLATGVRVFEKLPAQADVDRAYVEQLATLIEMLGNDNSMLQHSVFRKQLLILLDSH